VNIKEHGQNLVIAILMIPIGMGLGIYVGKEPVKPKPIIVKTIVPKGMTPESAKKLALSKLDDYGWKQSEFACLDKIWTHESHWNYKAVSKTHDHGIPQRNMPDASKKQIHSFMTDPVVQINWGLAYIESRYHTPCRAWAFWQTHRWY
jgi:hypothetical protein